jgi:hypothetical protein
MPLVFCAFFKYIFTKEKEYGTIFQEESKRVKGKKYM